MKLGREWWRRGDRVGRKELLTRRLEERKREKDNQTNKHTGRWTDKI